MSMSSECIVYCYSDEKYILFWVSRKTMGDWNSNNVLKAGRQLCVKKKKRRTVWFPKELLRSLKKAVWSGDWGGTHSSYWTFCKLSEFHSSIKYESNNILYDHKMCLLLSLSWKEEISQSILQKIINKQPLIVILRLIITLEINFNFFTLQDSLRLICESTPARKCLCCRLLWILTVLLFPPLPAGTMKRGNRAIQIHLSHLVIGTSISHLRIAKVKARYPRVLINKVAWLFCLTFSTSPGWWGSSMKLLCSGLLLLSPDPSDERGKGRET